MTARTTALRNCSPRESDIHLIRHERNRGYGAALMSAFEYAISRGYDVLVTIDCDGQHQPQLIPRFLEACESRRHRLREPLSAPFSRRYRTARGTAADQPRHHRRVESLARFAADRRLLRLQGVSHLRVGSIPADRNRLRHAVGALGSSQAASACESWKCRCR